jgi:uncharacterized protein YbjT (DUF2867 family)
MILIIGSTGHIGKELVPQLLQSEQHLRVLVRDEQRVADLDPSIERAVGDLNDLESLTYAMRGVERVFLVTLTTQQDLNVLEAAKRTGVKHIIKLSTMEASEHKIAIGKWAFEREELIRASGLNWTFLRPGMFMSNSIGWWAATIKSQGAVYFPGGKGKVAPVDSRDIAAVAALALTQPGHNGQIYELTGSELLTVREMVGIISRALGKSLRYTDIPPFVAKFWMSKSGMNKRMVNALMEMLKSLRRNEGANATDTIQRLTGRPPRTFEEWCRENVDAFRA